MDNWQLCPKCKGDGHCFGTTEFIECPVCKGTMLISVFTGLPPARPLPKSNTNTTITLNDDSVINHTN